MFKWKEVSTDNVITFLKTYFDHCGYGMHDQTKIEGKITFSIRHDLGKKGSLFLKTFLETVVKSTLGKNSSSTLTTNSLVFSFQE